MDGSSLAVGDAVVIRRATPDDLEGLRRCLDAVARERRWLAFLEAPSLEEIRTFVAARAPIRLVADHRGEIVGWCDVSPFRIEGFRHGGALGMGVLAEHRGRGVGAELLRRTVEAALAAGLTRIELEVFGSNAAAIALYERAGFVHEGRKVAARAIDGRVEDSLVMALVVPPGERGRKGR